MADKNKENKIVANENETVVEAENTQPSSTDKSDNEAGENLLIALLIVSVLFGLFFIFNSNDGSNYHPQVNRVKQQIADYNKTQDQQQKFQQQREKKDKQPDTAAQIYSENIDHYWFDPEKLKDGQTLCNTSKMVQMLEGRTKYELSKTKLESSVIDSAHITVSTPKKIAPFNQDIIAKFHDVDEYCQAMVAVDVESQHIEMDVKFAILNDKKKVRMSAFGLHPDRSLK